MIGTTVLSLASVHLRITARPPSGRLQREAWLQSPPGSEEPGGTGHSGSLSLHSCQQVRRGLSGGSSLVVLIPSVCCHTLAWAFYIRCFRRKHSHGFRCCNEQFWPFLKIASVEKAICLLYEYFTAPHYQSEPGLGVSDCPLNGVTPSLLTPSFSSQSRPPSVFLQSRARRRRGSRGWGWWGMSEPRKGAACAAWVPAPCPVQVLCINRTKGTPSPSLH